MADDELVTEILNEYGDDATELAYQLKAENISPNEWRDQMAELTAVVYVAMWLFGKQSTSIASDERAVIEQLLNEQYQYLDAFATQIDEYGISDIISVTDFLDSETVGGIEGVSDVMGGVETANDFIAALQGGVVGSLGALSLMEVIRRAKMYINSARQAFERAKTYAYGNLPAYPGDGSTICLSNCRCHWELQFSANNLVAYWRLGTSDNCKTCIERASNWNPYIVPLEEVK